MPKNVALLRGINVGGKNMVSMAALREFFTDIGFREPTTLLQSGNVVFSDDSKRSTLELEAFLEDQSKEKLHIQPAFIVRSSREIDRVVAGNPFPKEAEEDPSHLLVLFLRENADFEKVEKMRETCVGPEVIHAEGKDLYIYYPIGIGDSKLKITLLGTGRNWNTLLKLQAMMAG